MSKREMFNMLQAAEACAEEAHQIRLTRLIQKASKEAHKIFEVTPFISVDVAVVDKDGRVLIIRRSPDSTAYPNMWALPGGFYDVSDKSLEHTAIREAKEETGLNIQPVALVGIYSERNRDPRGPVISVLYLCKQVDGVLKAGDDASEAQWEYLAEVPVLAFDHNKMIDDVMDVFIQEE